jgi:protein-tyrosine kinase
MSFIERAIKKIKDDQQRLQHAETPATRPDDRVTSAVAASSTDASEAITRKAEIKERLRKAEMLVPGGLGQKFIDEYRRIKRPLLANAFGKNASLVDHGNLVLVTSSVPNEGKSFTAVNLALAIAQEQDHTVLLVDCDSVRKAMSRMLGLENETGLTDVLEKDGMDIASVMWHTDVTDLVVIPAGAGTDKVTELYASNKMSNLVAQLLSRYRDRVIIFDSPPLLVTTQTQVLAGLVGQVVLVIHAGATPVEVVRQALEMVPPEKATGIVLNKSANIFRSYTRGYDGYYGYKEYK